MKKLIGSILFTFLIIPFGAKANDNYSVEIEALTLVMEQYKESTSTESGIEIGIDDKKPSYMALKQDECNATVEVTEKTGLEIVNTESYDVNVCKKEIYKIIN